jgi:hypothetical protein
MTMKDAVAGSEVSNVVLGQLIARNALAVHPSAQMPKRRHRARSGR